MLHDHVVPVARLAIVGHYVLVGTDGGLSSFTRTEGGDSSLLYLYSKRTFLTPSLLLSWTGSVLTLVQFGYN